MLLSGDSMIVNCWHFIRSDENNRLFLANGDGREVFTRKPISVRGTPRLGQWGLHGSKLIIEAIRYAPQDTVLCQVNLWGGLTIVGDLCAANKREITSRLRLDTKAEWQNAVFAKITERMSALINMPSCVQEYVKTRDPMLYPLFRGTWGNSDAIEYQYYAEMAIRAGIYADSLLGRSTEYASLAIARYEKHGQTEAEAEIERILQDEYYRIIDREAKDVVYEYSVY